MTMTAAEMGRKRWAGVSKKDKTAHAMKMAEVRMAPPEDKGQVLDVKGLVKTFGRSRGFFFRMIKEGKLKTLKQPGGKHWVRVEDAGKLVRHLAEKNAGK
jgi:hypothetical protein